MVVVKTVRVVVVVGLMVVSAVASVVVAVVVMVPVATREQAAEILRGDQLLTPAGVDGGGERRRDGGAVDRLTGCGGETGRGTINSRGTSNDQWAYRRRA